MGPEWSSWGVAMDQVFKILLLEDVDRDAELIAYELGKAEVAFVVNRVVNRESFLQALETFRPHLILADYRLPSFDGLTALALAQEVCSGVPFIFVTEVANEELAEKSRKMRAAAFIPQDRLKRLGPKAKSAPAA
jgi:CheY-like chemotaxis protein